MDGIEISTDGELFRIRERRQPDGLMSYDFTWLNGPNDGTYGFTVGLSITGRDFTGSHVGSSDTSRRMSHEQLENEVRGFVRGFYEQGGIRDEDFPNHVDARTRQENGGR